MTIVRGYGPVNMYVYAGYGSGPVAPVTGVEAGPTRISLQLGPSFSQNILGNFFYDYYGNLTYFEMSKIEVYRNGEKAGDVIINPSFTSSEAFFLNNPYDLASYLYSGSDYLYGGRYADILWGMGADDLLQGGGGADLLDGGAGNRDEASYVTSPTAVNVQLNAGVGRFGDAGGDRLINIEELTGSRFNDILVGDGRNNVLRGGVGDDRLTGLGGVDVFIGGSGADRINGGAGFDWVHYDASRTGVNVQLRSGLTLYGDAQGDRLIGIEGLGGSVFDDVLVGDNASNTLSGLGGNDVLRGFAGVDKLEAGPGADRLEGGAGTDYFVLSYLGRGVDVILDFVSGENGDVIDLSPIIRDARDSDDPHAFVRLVDRGGDALLRVDPNGPAGGAAFVDLALIKGGAKLDLDAMIAAGDFEV